MTDEQPAQVDEFDVVAAWTADALIGRDRSEAIVGACNGSASPAALAWLAESLRLDGERTLLDVGCGLGGALAWAVDRYGVAGLGVEPMSSAARRGAELFGHDVLTATAERLPLADGSAGCAWALGVLDTVDDPGAAIGELRRVLAPSGRLGLLAYVAVDRVSRDQVPEGNEFQTAQQLLATLEGQGFGVLDTSASDQLPEPPAEWRDVREAMELHVRRHHGEDPRWTSAHEQRRRMAELLDRGQVAVLLVHARRR